MAAAVGFLPLAAEKSRRVISQRSHIALVYASCTLREQIKSGI